MALHPSFPLYFFATRTLDNFKECLVPYPSTHPRPSTHTQRQTKTTNKFYCIKRYEHIIPPVRDV